ncbi:hypothetical protein L3Q82_017029 [Scortum barcoo]|uniref:Uncharacterized protein n=1 Tax=Scortum barcoo TaxID=214431 RepID=A0ACB8X9D8_9TELE|nr:hypothetical protein L3Q82_017029 [Scortum barcoo]
MMELFIFLVLLSKLCQASAVDKTSGITQESGLIIAEVGQTVTLKCFCQNDAVTFLSWYQQSLGDKPLLISSRMKHKAEANISPAYKDRFQVIAQSEHCGNHLEITNLHLSDSATYYCGVLEFNAIEFGQGVFLYVKTSPANIQAVVHQSALAVLNLGDSVNLHCTIYAESYSGKQSLYWFRPGVAQPAVMPSSTGQCVNDSESPVKRKCTSNLVINSVRSSDAGMYYCALASSGEIVFGNGTRVEIAGSSTKRSPVLMLCLCLTLAFNIIMVLVLAFVMYKLKKKLCSVCKGTVSHLTCSAASDATSQDADALHYAALSLNRTSELHRQEESEEIDMNALKLSSSLRFVSVDHREDVTLECFYEDNAAVMFYWYKQSPGQKPQLLSKFYKHDKADSATYYCIGGYSYAYEFLESIIIHVKDSDFNVQTLVHQSASESIQPGGSVTLNCTVHSGTCDGEHSVYWFKQSEESHPGLIYTHGDRNDQCERKPNTQTHTCVYNLPMENLNVSHAGTYYCAVASCGHILFGNGTKLDIEDDGHSPVLVYFLSGAVAFTAILAVFLAHTAYTLYTAKSCQGTAQMTHLKSSIYVRQEDGFVSANVGDSVTFQCFYGGYAVMVYWYKQPLGQKPRLISTFYRK